MRPARRGRRRRRLRQMRSLCERQHVAGVDARDENLLAPVVSLPCQVELLAAGENDFLALVGSPLDVAIRGGEIQRLREVIPAPREC